MKIFKSMSWCAATFLAVFATAADASHFRGAAMVPSVDASGLLTVETDSFWRKNAPTTPLINVTGVGNMATATNVQDDSDIRRTKLTTTSTIQLPGPGTYSINWDSCCHQAGISNAGGGWGMDASIVWDGQTASQPIFFDLENIQQQVAIGAPYSDNLDATPAPGLTLSHSLVVNTGMTGQAPGLAVDAAGNLTLSAATTGAAPYNPGFTNGTAFAGNIEAKDATGATVGSVEYEWLFLSCDPNQGGCNVVPEIQDVVLNALVGDTINQTMLAVEDAGQAFVAPNLLTTNWDALQSFNCSAGAPGNAPSWNAGTQAFSWDSTGTGVGQCTAIFRVTDSQGLTDTGSLLINLTTAPQCGTPGQPPCPPTGVSTPHTLPLMALGLLLLTSVIRRKQRLNS